MRNVGGHPWKRRIIRAHVGLARASGRGVGALEWRHAGAAFRPPPSAFRILGQRLDRADRRVGGSRGLGWSGRARADRCRQRLRLGQVLSRRARQGHQAAAGRRCLDHPRRRSRPPPPRAAPGARSHRLSQPVRTAVASLARERVARPRRDPARVVRDAGARTRRPPRPHRVVGCAGGRCRPGADRRQPRWCGGPRAAVGRPVPRCVLPRTSAQRPSRCRAARACRGGARGAACDPGGRHASGAVPACRGVSRARGPGVHRRR